VRHPSLTVASPRKRTGERIAVARAEKVEKRMTDIFGTVAGQELTGTDSGDRIYGFGGQDRLYGKGGKDRLYGGAGHDFLDGGAGADIMFGRSGHDTYRVDDAGDAVSEETVAGTDAGGIDTVQSSITFTLGRFLENLTLTGTAAINGTGNALANWITGNGAANTLSGGGGNDILVGREGNDRLSGGAGNDWLSGDAGHDWLSGGAGNDILAGGRGPDTLSGGAGNDWLIGGAGKDALTGGIGTDTFVFGPPAAISTDTVTDFTAEDRVGILASNYGLRAGSGLVNDGTGQLVLNSAYFATVSRAISRARRPVTLSSCSTPRRGRSCGTRMVPAPDRPASRSPPSIRAWS
jgi:Ca2+-binding RTX toxin-like protein